MSKNPVYPFSESEAKRLQMEFNISKSLISKYRFRGSFPKRLYEGNFSTEKKPISATETKKVIEIVSLLSKKHWNSVPDFKLYKIETNQSQMYEHELINFKRELTVLTNLLKDFRKTKGVKRVQFLKSFLLDSRVHKMKFFYYKNEEHFTKYQSQMICDCIINDNEIIKEYEPEINMIVDLRLQFFTF